MPILAALLTGVGFGSGFKVADGLDSSLRITENTEKVVELGKNVVNRAQEWVQDTIRLGQEPVSQPPDEAAAHD